jgi:serine protease Do
MNTIYHQLKYIAIAVTMVPLFLLTACANSDYNQFVINDEKGVVAIMSTSSKTDDKGNHQQALGTGFFIADNEILTNNHVIEESTKIEVATQFGEENFTATVVVADKLTDIAIIKIDDWEKFKKTRKYKVLNFADGFDLKETQEVYSIGHPWGLYWTISKGIISYTERGFESLPIWFIQSDVHIFNGNSGGPLVNSEGDVLGINARMEAQDGGSFGFTIPVRMVTKVIHDLKKYNEVRFASVGINLNEDLIIQSITADSPAEKAGLKANDKIITVKTNEGQFTPRSATEVVIDVSNSDYTQNIVFEIERDGQKKNIVVTPKYKTSNDFQPLPNGEKQ